MLKELFVVVGFLIYVRCEKLTYADDRGLDF